ncbi:MAG TPA: DUF523 and DUF1722 domain-containing protein [Blastocatellia bacterium]|nr:DUF523 and DUF1722 domain-containing protein [Blastocatellia bacterium]
MRDFAKPVVVLSQCLELQPCRFDGQVIPNSFVKQLAPYVTLIPVCPEMEIGLGVPREPVRIIVVKGQQRLIQPATNLDLSDRMQRFAQRFLASLDAVDGFILKSRSPSCGIKDVRAYLGVQKGAATKLTSGFFARAVLERFPGVAIEDEGRLTNFKIREHFLTKLFALASLRSVATSPSMKALIRFHTANKFLLMAYSQKELRNLGRIVANPERKPIADVIEQYRTHFQAALARPARTPSIINVLQHGLGYFSDKLSGKEKAFFLQSLQMYRQGKIPLSAVVSILRAWVVRFENTYLMEQTFFEPYPEALVEISDSGRGRPLSV